MIRTKITGLVCGACALAILVPSATHAWTGEVPETESLPLWLLGLFVTLMLFRVRAVLGRKRHAAKVKVKR